jgi:hypothetical protein
VRRLHERVQSGECGDYMRECRVMSAEITFVSADCKALVQSMLVQSGLVQSVLVQSMRVFLLYGHEIYYYFRKY